MPIATAQLARFHMPGPVDAVMREQESYWLDLCLTPRPANARACFRAGRASFGPIGEVFLAPPGQGLHTRSDGGDQLSMLCHLHPEQIERWFDGDFRWSDRRLEALLDIGDTRVRGLLMRLAEEARAPGFASDMLVELVAAQLAIEVARHCATLGEAPVHGGLAPWRLRRIDERLAAGGDIPTLAELAEACGLSVRQLTRGFRASRGHSIGTHVAANRIEHARRLLATDRCIKAIAHRLGFASPSAFAHAFRRETGETPRRYRERLRGG